MPPQTLPEKAKEVYLAAEKSAKKTCSKGEGYEECVARKSWAAVKRGWKKEGDKWVPKSVAEFSFYIYRASINKETQEMQWFATASDTEEDTYNDNMTLELYEDFLGRIESKELPPEKHRSEYWSGGMPYLSISHYLDLNGEAVPGEVKSVYVDGNKLKAKGTFFSTPLGIKCYQAVLNDLYSEEKSHSDPVRISIAFIDWGHRHKSNEYEFIRESLGDICPECLKELLTGESEGKEFLKGHLIHLAMTRVPVNERTEMEASMVTQLEDAKSIVGEDEAEKLEELATDEIGKADLVIKSEADEDEPVVDEVEEEDEEEEVIVEEEAIVEEAELEAHPLDELFATFRSSYDEILAQGLPYEQSLAALQEPFNVFGESIKELMMTPEDKEAEHERSLLDEVEKMVTPLVEAVQNLTNEVSILKQQSQATGHETPPAPDGEKVVRRSFQIDQPYRFMEPTAPQKPMSVSDIVRRNANLTQ